MISYIYTCLRVWVDNSSLVPGVIRSTMEVLVRHLQGEKQGVGGSLTDPRQRPVYPESTAVPLLL